MRFPTCIKMTLLVIFFIPLIAEAQLKAKLVKVHINYNRLGVNGHRIGDLAPAVVLQGRRNFEHEVELNKFKKIKSPSDVYYDPYRQAYVYNRIKNFSLGLRYQFAKNLRKKTDAKLLPQLGFSFLPLYESALLEPGGSSIYKRKSKSYSINFAIVPQLRCRIVKRFCLDFAVPLNFFSYQFIYLRIFNPNIPPRQQRNSGTETHLRGPKEMIENLQVRLGIAIKL
jgi:hypothetical protein